MKQFSQPTKFSRPTKLLTSLALSAFILTGCGDESSTKQPSKEEIQYLSHIDQAEFYQRQGQLKASILEARNAMELQHSKIEPFMIVGQNLLIAGDGRSAQKQFQSILDSDAPEIKTNSEVKQEVSILLARSLFIQRKADDALIILSGITTTSTELKVKKLLLLADIALSQKDFKQAEKYLNDTLTADSNSIEALIGLSKSAFLQKDLAESSKFINSAEKINPNSPLLWLWKAQVAQYEKRWTESEEAYIKALEDIGSYDIMTFEKYKTISDLIVVLREQGKAAEAFVYEEVLAKSSPGTIKSTYMSAVKNFQNGEFKKAEADFESILDQSPGHVESGILLGITKYYLGNFVEAEKILSTYLKESAGSAEASKILAATKLKLKQPKEAKELLAKLDKTGNDPQLLALFGIASLTSGDTKTGLEYINKSLKINPKNSQLRLKLAQYYNATGNTEEAISHLKSIETSSPDIHKANIQLVAIYTKNNQEKDAINLVSSWKKTHPKNAEPFIAEAGMATFKQQFSKAESLLKQAAKTDTSNISSLALLANVQVKLNKQKEALTTLETAITKQPGNSTILARYLSLSSLNKSNDEALTFLNKLSNNQPDKKILQLAVAQLQARQGNMDKALEITNKLSASIDDNTKLQPAIEAIYSIGTQAALKNNKPEEALKLAKEARETLPNSLKLGLLLASIELKLDNTDDAMDTLRELKIAHSDSEVPYEFEGDYYASIKEYARAADSYTLARAKKNSDKVNAKIYSALKTAQKKTEALEHLKEWNQASPASPRAQTLLALHYQSANQKQKAIALYEQLVASNSNDVISLNNLAWLYFETNNSAAESTAKKAFDLKPNSAAVADTYGWILYKNNKVKQSEIILKKAYDLAPKAKEIAMHLAEVYEAQGNTTESNAIKSAFN